MWLGLYCRPQDNDVLPCTRNHAIPKNSIFFLLGGPEEAEGGEDAGFPQQEEGSEGEVEIPILCAQTGKNQHEKISL